MLEYEMLMDLEEELSERLKYDLPGILISLNRNERLRDCLDLMGMRDLLPVLNCKTRCNPSRSGLRP